MNDTVTALSFSKDKIKVAYGKLNWDVCIRNVFDSYCSTTCRPIPNSPEDYNGTQDQINKKIYFLSNNDSILIYSEYNYVFVKYNETLEIGASFANTICMYDFKNKIFVNYIQSSSGSSYFDVYGLIYSYIGNNFAYIFSDTNISIIKYLVDYFTTKYINSKAKMISIAFEPIRTGLYIGMSNGMLLRKKLDDLNKTDTIFTGKINFENMIISPNGRQIFTYHSDSTIDIFDLVLGIFVDHAKLPSAITALAVSPDGMNFATGCADGSVWVWKSDNLTDVDYTTKPENIEPFVYPNPFVGTTNIRYFLSNTSLVKLITFDALGNEVAEIVNSVQEAGEHIAEFDAAGLAPGLYFYKLQAGDRVFAGKLVSVK
ncbi:MAG: 5'-nucleotidase protein [Ignavibacteria bacterium]|nr:5'-nucleotidase protein [Ignavibacteria bacterium]